MTLLKTLPTIVSSFRDSIRDLRGGQKNETIRTERDLPLGLVVVGTAVLAAHCASAEPAWKIPRLAVISALIVLFGFFFVTVASRIVGIIGSSSNPISGMTIATLMGTCLVFITIGWRGDAYQAAALLVGSVVCIASANAERDFAGFEDRISRRSHAV